MIVHRCMQGSEAWERLRKGKATASRFKDILTPAKLQLSKSAVNYAAEIVAERLGIESPEFPQTYWMQWGTEAEEYAVDEFEKTTDWKVDRVGFVERDEWTGCSPDGFVGTDAIIEIKCPKPETLIKYLQSRELPDEYRLQVQSSLWMTGRDFCHFYAWHPQIEPMHVVVESDPVVFAALDNAVPVFVKMVQGMMQSVKSRPMPSGFQFIDMSEDLE